jgi:hypothetical protein
LDKPGIRALLIGLGTNLYHKVYRSLQHFQSRKLLFDRVCSQLSLVRVDKIPFDTLNTQLLQDFVELALPRKLGNVIDLPNFE